MYTLKHTEENETKLLCPQCDEWIPLSEKELQGVEIHSCNNCGYDDRVDFLSIAAKHYFEPEQR